MVGTGSDAAPREGRGTVVFRPRMIRVVGWAVGVIMLLALVGGGVLMPGYTPLDRIGSVLLGLGVAVFCYRQATVSLVAAPETLTVRNLFRTRTLTWPEVVGISFPMGDPWAHLDLADGTTLATWALQRADGKAGIADAHRLAALIRDRGEAPDHEA